MFNQLRRLKREANSSPINWKDENNLSVGGLNFYLSVSDYESVTAADRIVLLKNRGMIDYYMKLLSDPNFQNILEYGIWQGGSPLFLAATSKAKRIVGIDIRGSTESIDRHVEKFRGRLRLFWDTSQSDREAVNKIVDENFNCPLDLVIDDASHQYEHTKAAFEIAFPRLRVGGLYIIEDWNWAHYADDWVDKHFKDEYALSNLALQIAMAVGSWSPIESVHVLRWFLVIKKGGETPSDFSLDKAIRLRKERVFTKF